MDPIVCPYTILSAVPDRIVASGMVTKGHPHYVLFPKLVICEPSLPWL